MRKIMLQISVAGIIICLICVGLSGCGMAGNSVSQGDAGTNTAAENSPEVLNVFGNAITVADYNLYIIQYFYNYGITPDRLDEAGVNMIMDSATDNLKAEMVRKRLVEEAGLTASEAQLTTIELMVDAFYGTFGEEFLSSYGINEADVRAMVERQLDIYLLTEKAEEELFSEYMDQYEEEYEEYQFRDMYYVLFPSIRLGYDENGELIVDDAGNPIPLTEEEMAEQRALAEEFRERAVEGLSSGDASASMEILAAEYGVEPYSNKQYYVNGLYDDELSQMVESLSNGEISEVTLTDVGYMIVRMDNSNDTEYKEQMITQLAAQSAEENKDARVQSWVDAAGAGDIQPDQELLNTIDVMALCEDMIERGIWFDQNNLNVQ